MPERRSRFGKTLIIMMAILVVAAMAFGAAVAQERDERPREGPNPPCAPTPRDPPWPFPHCRPGEEPPPPECSDGVDNDRDGLVDEEDPGCAGPEDDDETDPVVDTCADGEDNDGDGLTDGDDPECQDPEDGVEDGSDVVDTCADGEDNDGDGLTDGDDPECQDPEDGVEDGSDVDGAGPTCGDPDGDGVDHSSFDPEADETGPLSSVVHEVDQALPSPLGGDGGVVSEVNCALIAGALGL